jgi:hypothetical protein
LCNLVGAGSSKIFIFHFQDIYEGTEFHPVSSAENCLKKENYYSLFVRLSISQIVTTVTSRQVFFSLERGRRTASPYIKKLESKVQNIDQNTETSLRRSKTEEKKEIHPKN